MILKFCWSLLWRKIMIILCYIRKNNDIFLSVVRNYGPNDLRVNFQTISFLFNDLSFNAEHSILANQITTYQFVYQHQRTRFSQIQPWSWKNASFKVSKWGNFQTSAVESIWTTNYGCITTFITLHHIYFSSFLIWSSLLPYWVFCVISWSASQKNSRNREINASTIINAVLKTNTFNDS